MEKELAKKEVKITVKSLISTEQVKARFNEVLGKKSGAFLASILSAININPSLSFCDANSVINSALVAATLDLPINQSLGFAHLVPYSGKSQFQIGWRGLVQLAIRTGQYTNIGVTEVYSDELKSYNPITEKLNFTPEKNWLLREKENDADVIGFFAYFSLKGGFKKSVYITVAKAKAHGKKFSKTFETGRWKDDFAAMAKKTVLKMLLSKWGILSTEIQVAITHDQAIIGENGELNYVDNATVEEPIAMPKEKKKEQENDAIDDVMLGDDIPEFGEKAKK